MIGSANTYTGTTTITNGNVTLGAAGTLANTPVITIGTGAKLMLGSSGGNQIQASATTPTLTINGTLEAITGVPHTLYATTITLNNGTMNSTTAMTGGNYGAFYVGANRTITANGATNTISGLGRLGIASGFTLTLDTPLVTDALNISTGVGIGANGTAGGLTKTGLGSLTLAGPNTYAGPTTVNGGTLVISGANATTGATTVAGGTLNLDYTTAG